jgi:hypothetical protein
MSNRGNFERAVVAFLNSHEGGLLYIGVDDNGEVFGIDDIDATQLFFCFLKKIC